MSGTAETVSGGTLVAVGIALLQGGVTVIGTDLVTGVASIAVGAGLVGIGFYAISVGLTKKVTNKVTNLLKK